MIIKNRFTRSYIKECCNIVDEVFYKWTSFYDVSCINDYKFNLAVASAFWNFIDLYDRGSCWAYVNYLFYIVNESRDFNDFNKNIVSLSNKLKEYKNQYE